MDEAGARALMERLGATQQPPSRVDIGLARQRGGTLLRRRRWGLAAAPLLAAAAVVAVILGAGAITGGGGGRGTGAPPAQPAASAHHRFNPVAPYAAFGWLPGGSPLAASSPGSTPEQLQLTAGSAAKGQFMLTVWAPAACDLNAAQARADLRGQQHPTLYCTQRDGDGWAAQLSRPAPAIAGHPGFWFDGHMLAWEYGPDAWATLYVFRHGGPIPAAAIVKVAAHVRYAATAKPSVKFPFQLTGMPASWRVLSANWAATADGLLGARSSHELGGYTVVGPPHGSVRGVIGQIVVMRGKSTCPFFRGSSRRVVLGGVQAIVTRFTGSGVPPYQGLCIPETNGLHVFFLEFPGPGRAGFAFGGVTGVFTRHLRLLGPDPANWTTRPLG